MEHWDLRTVDVEVHKPVVLHSTRGAARSVVLRLPAGEALSEHQVHERAHVVVADGEVEVEVDHVTIRAAAGALFVFDPGERHEVRAITDARLLLVLAPWPGEGHPGARD